MRESGGLPTKTGTHDESVVLDRPDLLHLDVVWKGFHQGRPADAALIPLTQAELAGEIKSIFEEIGGHRLGVVAYSLRHAGPSWDFLVRFRDLAEIQQRGRWRSSTSVLR